MSLDKAYDGRDNAFNLLRLCFALLVMVGHAGVIGWGVGHEPVRLLIDTGGVAVTGFFALSGFLIARSGRRTSPLRFAWHRVLRIFPGFWVCLLVMAFGLAPMLYLHQHGSLAGFLDAGDGPLQYVWHGLLTDQQQSDVSGVTRDAAFSGAINGSLWTLKYELTCYLLVLALAVTAVLRRARWTVLAGAAVLMAVLVWDTLHDPATPGPLALVSPVHVPVLGWYLRFYAVVFGLAFLLGMAADLYRAAIPLNDWLGGAALLLAAGALWLGWPLFGPFLVAYVYLLLWAGVRLPAALRRIGRRNDYSYGVYIYAFPIQQALAIAGLPRYGWAVYLATSVLAVFAVAAASWHLVEKPAMRLKDWTPARYRTVPSQQDEGAVPSRRADSTVPSQRDGDAVPAQRDGDAVPAQRDGDAVPSQQEDQLERDEQVEHPAPFGV